jgi:hypothetical protein
MNILQDDSQIKLAIADYSFDSFQSFRSNAANDFSRG